MNNFTIDQLESVKFLLNSLFIAATFGVWIGVYLEKETFSKTTQDKGWKLLVLCLGFETFFGAMLWQIDSSVNTRQKAEILELETQIAPRRLNSQQCIAVADSLASFSGRKVRVATYAGDADGSTLGTQIAACMVHAKTVDVDGAIASIMPLGGFGAGVFVSGSDEKLVAAIRDALGTKAKLVLGEGSGRFTGNMSIGENEQSNPPPATFVLVGVKPVADFAIK